jgi:Na+-driven multidrug efflux pump
LMDSWRRLLVITGPAALANMITPMATAVLTATIAVYGPEAVAAYGVVSRLESFIMIVVLGMSMSVPPFISQNFGAHRYDRVRQGLRLSLKFVLVWQLALYVIVALLAPWIAAIFTADQSVRDMITMVLRILPASYAFQGMVVLSASSFNALHAPRHGLATSLLRFFVFYVPLALIGNSIGGLQGLFIGSAIGNVLAGVVITKWISAYTKRLLKQPLPA